MRADIKVHPFRQRWRQLSLIGSPGLGAPALELQDIAIRVEPQMLADLDLGEIGKAHRARDESSDEQPVPPAQRRWIAPPITIAQRALHEVGAEIIELPGIDHMRALVPDRPRDPVQTGDKPPEPAPVFRRRQRHQHQAQRMRHHRRRTGRHTPLEVGHERLDPFILDPRFGRKFGVELTAAIEEGEPLPIIPLHDRAGSLAPAARGVRCRTQVCCLSRRAPAPLVDLRPHRDRQDEAPGHSRSSASNPSRLGRLPGRTRASASFRACSTRS